MLSCGRGSTTANSTTACATVKAGAFFYLQAQPDQKMMRQKGLGHMMMPASPRAGFIVIHPQFALGLFQSRLYWPAHATDAYQGGRRARRGSVGQKIFDLRGAT